MGKRKKLSEKKSKSNQSIDATMLQAIGKIRELDNRLRGLVNYAEYLAEMLDTSVGYSELLADEISRERPSNGFVNLSEWQNKNIPTFKDFRKLKRPKIAKDEHDEYCGN